MHINPLGEIPANRRLCDGFGGHVAVDRLTAPDGFAFTLCNQ
jgi:hypothetical protein